MPFNEMQNDVVKRVISQHAGAGSSADEVARAVVGALKLLHAELSFIVGLQAASALCAHALHRTRSKINWPTLAAKSLFEPMTVALLKELCLQSPTEIAFAGETLLSALVEHLILLIGEPLTLRMLESAWTVPGADQTSQEIL